MNCAPSLADMRIQVFVLCFVLACSASVDAQGSLAAQVPMTTRMALSELMDLRNAYPEDKAFIAEVSQYPVARMDGRLMVGFVGQLPMQNAAAAMSTQQSLS